MHGHHTWGLTFSTSPLPTYLPIMSLSYLSPGTWTLPSSKKGQGHLTEPLGTPPQKAKVVLP